MKASADVVTLVVAVVPITLFIILSGSAFMQKEIKTQLKVQTEIGNEEYGNMWNTYQLANFRNMRSLIQSYQENPNPDLSDQIELNVTEMFKRSRFKYNLTINFPKASNLQFSNARSTKVYNRLVIASRAPKPIKVNLKTRLTAPRLP